MSSEIKQDFQERNEDDGSDMFKDELEGILSELPSEPSGTAWDAIDSVAEEMHSIAEEKGFWNPELGHVKTPLEQVALWVSECAEAMEEIKGGYDLDLVYYTIDSKITDDYLRRTETEEGNPTREAIFKLWSYQKDVLQNGEKATAEAPTPYEMELLVVAGIAKPEGFGIEGADAVIRIMDSLARENISLGQMIRLKSLYNRTREPRHGKKF